VQSSRPDILEESELNPFPLRAGEVSA
jgi:hypothetical protein